MDHRSPLRARLRNALFRAVHRVPRGAVTPQVANDRFRAHESLFEFLGAFVSERKTLFVGNEAHGAFLMREGSENLTAVMTSRAALAHGRRTYVAHKLEFQRAIPNGQSYDVVMHSGPPRDLQPLVNALRRDGKLLISILPEEEQAALRDELSSRFASVRRFAHIASTPVDFSSPLFSIVPRSAFSFQEILINAPVPHNAIGVVYLATDEAKWRDLQLHLGCGPIALEGWINIDNQPYGAIDFRWDLARGIPFAGAKYIFAEHFIEHLTYRQGVELVRGCRAALRDDGVLRLSTPNLDCVYQDSYHPWLWKNEDDAMHDCFLINRAFRGWGHQFLYNLPALTALLENAGFTTVRAFRYGESDNPSLTGLERHEQYPDTPELPHILVVEASGRAEPRTIRGEADIAEYNRDVSAI